MVRASARPLCRSSIGALALVIALAGCNDYGFAGPEVLETPLEHVDDFDPEADTSILWLTVCPSQDELPATSAIDESCDTEPTTITLTTVVEWSRSDFGNFPEYNQVVTAPLVGQLTDDNGDGVIDRNDRPDIVLVADDNGAAIDRFGLLAVLDGVDGHTVLAQVSMMYGEQQVNAYRYATPALGDVDADGIPEIITVVRVLGGTGEPPDGGGDSGEPGPVGEPDDSAEEVPIGPPSEALNPDAMEEVCGVAAFHADGEVQWLGDRPVECAGHMVALADLDGDGYGEVLVDEVVFSHEGKSLWTMEGEARFAAYPEMGTNPVAIDLNVDGSPEVLSGRVVYEAKGTERCRIPERDPDGFPAAADLDGDGLGEFILVGDGQVHIYEDDCTPAASWSLVGSGNGGPPTVADFDGDGVAEIGVADAEVYAVYESDGTVLWSQPCTDASSHATGSSVFDFDGDGQSEVLYGDEITLWVFDGATGAIRLEDHEHTSRTLHELPTAADVDGDGEMEIVVPQGGGHYGEERGGVYVLGSGGDPWLGDRQVWNQHSWTLTNVEDDLTLPYPLRPNWPFSNTFRSGDLTASAGGNLPDAIGQIQVCDDVCPRGEIGVQVRLGNGGMAPMRAGVSLTVYAKDRGLEEVLLTLQSEDIVPAGGTSEQWEFTLPIASVPEGKLILRVDDDGLGGQLVNECHEDNNEFVLEGVGCPVE